LAHEPVDLLAVAVAGVGDDAGLIGAADAGQLVARLVDHRAHLAEVRRADRNPGGDDDLLLVADGLSVVARKNPRGVLSVRESGSVSLIFPVGWSGGV
jgi:hypothetical protein